MSSFFKSKGFIAVIVVTLITAAATAFFGSADNAVASGIRTIFSPVQTVVSGAASSIDRFRIFVMEMHGYKEENERLVSEIKELQKQNRSIEEYAKENDRLRNLLMFKEELTYNTVAAEIISYEPNNWYDTIVINRGTNDGLAVNNAVLTADGVVGKISEVGPNWARVTSILNTDNAMGVKVSRTGDIAVVEGDAVLSNDQQCKMTFIDKGATMIVGDLLETSGSGGIYPAGLKVGNIVDIKQDNAGILEYAIVEPSADFDNLYEVLVITDFEY